MSYPKFIISNQKEESISMQRVKYIALGIILVCMFLLDGGSEDMAHIGNGVVLISSVSIISKFDFLNV